MSTLVGWLDAPVGEIPGDLVLDAMIGKTAISRGYFSSLTSGTEAIAALSPADGSVSSSGALWSAIIGRPRWTTPELAVAAGRQGHASALGEAYRAHGAALFKYLRGTFAI